MAFGTGTHEKSHLCIGLLESYLRPSDVVLDVGTESGILTITAAKLGAAKVLGIDIDENAIGSARANVIQNGVENRVEICYGFVESLGSQTFDLLLVNIDRTTLTNLLPRLKRLTIAESRLILSGLLWGDRSSMEEVFSETGYRSLEVKTKGKWLGFVVTPC